MHICSFKEHIIIYNTYIRFSSYFHVHTHKIDKIDTGRYFQR